MPPLQSRQQDGATLDILADDAAGLRVTINRLGAEMISITRRDTAGKEHGFLWRDGELSAPAEGWGNHATVMGYFLHRLWEEKSFYRGHLIKGGNHGFLRHFVFDAPVAGENSLTYRVPVDRIPPDAYPLKVSLELTYRLVNGGVRIEFAFHNHEPELTAHLSFGIHPGFAVSSVDSCRLLLPPGVYVRHMAPENFLNGELERITHAGGESPFPKEDLPGSFILGLAEVPSRQIVLEDLLGGRRVRLDFSDVSYLTLWSDMHPFICVEPCWGLPDSKPPTAFEDKPGIQIIAPGGSVCRNFTIYPELLT